ncbi:MAG: glycogen synthase GlgA [Candidatus Omnitrophica bacterium]|nr:glycogen synthase GlgA [Candidatus Omnitrophota bacterium]MCM8810140.1 glycogen synthase GlgA [Candidatus Omnitrophota bacterium]
MGKKYNICLVSAEAVPFVKVGGMADVVGALYKYLKNKNIQNTYLFLPLYKKIKEKHKIENILPFEVKFFENRVEKGFIVKSKDFPNVYFIKNDDYFNRDEIYGESGTDYPDSLERFSFFSKSVLEALVSLRINIDIFHCHDWHTSLLPLYLKLIYNKSFLKAKTIFTIHNLGYQGIFSADKFPLLGIPWEYFNMDELEFYGKINFMKAGIIHSDKLTTVSPTYAKEILTPEYGHNLDGLLRKYQNKLKGILNGIDYQIWNPAFDPYIQKRYKKYKGKIANKISLQKKLSLNLDEEIPVFGMVTRLTEQKGIDYLTEIMETLMLKDLQIILLGDGEQKYINELSRWQKKFPEKLSFNLGFNEELAHQIYAGSDFFLMPSKFEPCGLGQMISFKYGTIPIARKVGGLVDTIEEYNFETEVGNGFLFEGESRDFLAKIEQALQLFKNKEKLERLVNKVMNLEFSWRASVKEYIKTYNELME